MGKVFRLHTTGDNKLQDWANSTVYNKAVIDNIEDPSGADAKDEITSIPSPFARMDLAATAFSQLNLSFQNDDKALDGTTIYHKLVSWTLDVAELFFHYDKFHNAGLINLIRWDKNATQNLVQSKVPGHKLLGQTLALFFDQDAKTFHFDRMDSLYILQYTGPGKLSQMDVVGATSPRSLFFTPANNLSFVTKQINFGRNKAFDDNTFTPLYKRDPEFINYLFALRRAYSSRDQQGNTYDFTQDFPEISDYLYNTYKILSDALKYQIDQLTDSSFDNYPQIDINAGNCATILGFNLRQQPKPDIAAVSDFIIKSSKKVNGNIPLALPVDSMYKKWIYVNGEWDSNTKVPVSDPKDINARLLPNDGSQYPYLTMNDFLEDTIIETEWPITNTDFFDGNYEDKTSESKKGYLLPIKPFYFQYFTIEDLKKNIKIERMNAVGNNGKNYKVRVTLSISVKKGDIVYVRDYMWVDRPINDKDGCIRNEDFTLVTFPMCQTPANVTPDYRVVYMAPNNTDSTNPTLSFVENNNVVNNVVSVDKQTKTIGFQKYPKIITNFISGNFDYIVMTDSHTQNIIIPLWKTVNPTKTFEFAVDFGTTNTHIEYKTKSDGVAQTFTSSLQCQMGILHQGAKSNPLYRSAIANNLVPFMQDFGQVINFPLRTLLSYRRNTNWMTPTYPYVTGNLPFYYLNNKTPDYNEIETNLKWDDESNNPAKIECYLGSILLFIRNVVLMNDGDLSATKLRWFYPTSMPANKITTLSSIWTKLYKHYFGNNTNNLNTVPESIAPYAYYKYYNQAGGDVLTIDIGGGTSDALIVDSKGNPALITSFRFAANALFGDGFIKGNGKNNGFVKHFKPILNDILKDNGIQTIIERINSISEEDGNTSLELISYFFSIKDSEDAKKIADKVDFINLLSSSAIAKTLFVIFYSAIMYHLAMAIKLKKIAINKLSKDKGTTINYPRQIGFSGNGSKLLLLLGADNVIGKSNLEEYTKRLFEIVSGEHYPHTRLQINTDPINPKAATCKGGLDTNIDTIPALKTVKENVFVLLGTNDNRFVTTETYDSLTQNDFQEVKGNVAHFTQIFYDLAKEFDITTQFGTIELTELEEYRRQFDTCCDTLDANLDFVGLRKSTSKIEETLFFYPITKLLNELATMMFSDNLLAK